MLAVTIKKIIERFYRSIRPVLIRGLGNEVILMSKCRGRLRITVYGNNNKILVKDGVFLDNVEITITGNNNIVSISSNGRLYKLRLTIVDDNNEFSFGVNAGARELDVLVMESKKVIIGDDSMISHGVHIRTTDSHKIVNRETGERINQAKNVIVGEHCWISQNVTLLKGTIIGNYSIVGFGSICSREYPDHCIIAGIPGKVIKENINWDRNLK